MMKRYLNIPLMLCLACLISSCSKEERHAWGSLDLSFVTDVRIEDAVKSAEALPEAEYADYTIMLYKGDALLWEVSFDEFTSDVSGTYRRVPAGDYLVYVENCTSEEAEEGMGQPHYAGSTAFSVTAGRTASVEVVCRQVNAKVTFAYASDFSQYFNPAGLSVSDAYGRKLALNMSGLSESHDEAEVMYFNVSEDGTAGLTYTLVAGDLQSDKVMRYDVTFIVEKCKWNKVTMTRATGEQQ